MRFLLCFTMLFWLEQALAQVPPTSKELFKPEYWIIEKTTAKTLVAFRQEHIEVSAKGGVTLWYHEPLEAPVSIRLQAKVVPTEDPVLRVSDLNFFWMAQDSAYPDDFFKRSSWRNGVFPHYYSLNLYYAGYGGNTNTTSRFRKYKGTYETFANSGERPPILKEYTDADHLLKADVWYDIHIEMNEDRVRFYVNDNLLFDLKDEASYTRGYFGLRTVKSKIQYRNLSIKRL